MTGDHLDIVKVSGVMKGNCKVYLREMNIFYFELKKDFAVKRRTSSFNI